MVRLELVLCLPMLLMPACKTTGSSSAAQSWTVNGQTGAAHALIVATVLKYYPEAGSAPAVVDQFATALQDAKTDQTESSDYVLQAYYAKSKNSNPNSESPFDLYVVQQFAALTNYAEVASSPGTALAYTGTTK